MQTFWGSKEILAGLHAFRSLGSRLLYSVFREDQVGVPILTYNASVNSGISQQGSYGGGWDLARDEMGPKKEMNS